jgi:catechol 2,3-dioxygenase-like lactoylglutathione lyase family enzyme
MMKFHEVAIFTDNVDSLAEFYCRLLNAEPAHRGDGIAIFQVGDTQILIHARYTPGPGDLPCENHTAFAVANLDRTMAELENRGLTVERPPCDYPWGRSAYLRDPEGRLLELHEDKEDSNDS